MIQDQGGAQGLLKQTTLIESRRLEWELAENFGCYSRSGRRGNALAMFVRTALDSKSAINQSAIPLVD